VRHLQRRPDDRHASQVSLALAALLTAGLVATACASQGGATAPAGPGPAKSSNGIDVYVRSCARCHGVYREGDRDAPKLDAVRMAGIGDEPLRLTIVNGKGRMPGFDGLSPVEVQNLITYLRTAS
jgi:mono/diheme cytochrome c family protein